METKEAPSPKSSPKTRKRTNPARDPDPRPQKRNKTQTTLSFKSSDPKPDPTSSSSSTPSSIVEKSTKPPSSTSIRTTPQAGCRPPKQHIIIQEETADLFSAAPRTLLLHACNCKGSWGAGIALAFRKAYPTAYQKYKAHCDVANKSGNDLLGTTLLLAPQPSKSQTERTRKHWIGCLFTSVGFGRAKGGKEEILEATRAAMEDLVRQIESREGDDVHAIEEARMCRINSGLFGVPWEETRAVLEGVEVKQGSVMAEMKVVKPAG